jgi:hypothetical protein
LSALLDGRRAALGLLAAVASPLRAATAAPLRVVIPALHPSSQEHAAYFPQLLRLALEKTVASDGPFELQSFNEEMSSPRQVAELRHQGAINVMWDGTNRQRETELLPIRISLLRQLNDYRVFLIRQEDQRRFSAVRSLADLRRFAAGAGVNWPSTDVLRASQLPVVTSISYESLFPMLQGKRFDYLPRGVYEAWYEQREHADKGLAIEQTIFLHYQVPFYFFVSRGNPALADRIERGLKLAQDDGSFDKLFHGFPAFKRSLDEIHSGRRRVFELRLP